MRLQYNKIMAAFLGAFLIFGSACSSNPAEPSSFSQASSVAAESSALEAAGAESGVPENPEKKTVTYAIAELPASLDTDRVINAVDAMFLYHTQEGLVRLFNGEVKPGLAESWDVTESGLTYTFHLREATWEDGDPVTAYDFAYAFLRLLKSDSLSPSMMVVKNAIAYRAGNVADYDLGIVVIDDQTLSIELEHPAPYFLDLLAADNRVYPLQEDVVTSSEDAYAQSAETYLSCGPFRIRQWDEEGITLEKNPYYWEAEQVHLDEIQCLVIPDGATRALMYEDGALNAYLEMHCDNEAFYTDPHSFFGNTLITVQENLTGTSQKAGKLLKNRNFMAALSYAIDRESFVDEVMITGSVATNRFATSDMKSAGGCFTEEYPMKGAPLAGDAEQAKQYLNKALTQEDLQAGSLPKMTFVCYDTEQSVAMAQWLVQQWETVLGLSQIEVVALPADEAVQRCVDRKYDLFLQFCVGEYIDPYAQLSLWTADSAINWTDWADEAYDEQLDATNQPANAAKRDQELAACERYLIQNGPQIPLCYRGFLYDTAENITNVGVSSAGVNLQLIYADMVEEAANAGN